MNKTAYLHIPPKYPTRLHHVPIKYVFELMKHFQVDELMISGRFGLEDDLKAISVRFTKTSIGGWHVDKRALSALYEYLWVTVHTKQDQMVLWLTEDQMLLKRKSHCLRDCSRKAISNISNPYTKELFEMHRTQFNLTVPGVPKTENFLDRTVFPLNQRRDYVYVVQNTYVDNQHHVDTHAKLGCIVEMTDRLCEAFNCNAFHFICATHPNKYVSIRSNDHKLEFSPYFDLDEGYRFVRHAVLELLHKLQEDYFLVVSENVAEPVNQEGKLQLYKVPVFCSQSIEKSACYSALLLTRCELDLLRSITDCNKWFE